jgi:hypothetical protein
MDSAADKGTATREVASGREAGSAETAWMTGESTRATGKSAGMATKATWVTASESAPHVAAATATAVKSAAATMSAAPAASTTVSTAAAVLSEGRGSHREQRGEAHSPQRGLVT